MTNPIARADHLRQLTGLPWTAADKFHQATVGTSKIKLKREHDGVWTGTVIYRGMEYVLATCSGNWEEVSAWVGQLGLEAAQ